MKLNTKTDSMIEQYGDAAKHILICIRNVEAAMPGWQIDNYVFHGMADKRVLKPLLEEMVQIGLLKHDKYMRFAITDIGFEYASE